MNQKIAFFNKLCCCNNDEQFKKLLILNLAPVLKNIKPAELVVLKKSCFNKLWLNNKEKITSILGIKYKELYQSESKIYILFYDEYLLEKTISSNDSKKILSKLSYKISDSLNIILEELSYRFIRKSFPHEIGLFLGYPAKDVDSFITFKGKNYHYCRYWKVYHNLEESLKKFKAIDEARNYALLQLDKNINKTVRTFKTI